VGRVKPVALGSAAPSTPRPRRRRSGRFDGLLAAADGQRLAVPVRRSTPASPNPLRPMH